MASADSLTRITVFVRAGMTLILTSNCTPQPVRLQGERFCHRATEGDKETRRQGDKETRRHLILISPSPSPPLCLLWLRWLGVGGAMISAAGSELRRAW